MTYKKQIKLGVKFSVKLPNSREQQFEVTDLNDHVFDALGAEITNTTSYAPPKAFVVDKTNRVIKLLFDDNIPQTTALDVVVYGIVAEKNVVVENKVLFSDEKTQALKDAPKTMAAWVWKILKYSFWGFVAASILLYVIKDTKAGAVINKVWAYMNAAKIVEIAANFDAMIVTNNHPVYNSPAFIEVNKNYQRITSSGKELKDLYRYVGNNFFVTPDLIRAKDDSFIVLDREDAAKYCAAMGGRLLSIAELKLYLAKQYADVENFLWPVALRPDVPEWSETKQSFWDNYWVYLKNGENMTGKEPTIDGFLSVDEDDHGFAFRCGFDGGIYLSQEAK